jgi:alkylation response protein AidB-like acyl-CoA dehydrogenase
LIDGTWCGEIRFDKVRLTADRVLGTVGQGAGALHEALRYAALAACAEKVGMVLQAMLSTSEYLKIRKQFGATLSSFQALRHKIADMAIDGEMAKAALMKLVASFQAPEEHNPDMALSLAKVMLDEIGHRVCSQAIQLHGAMGLTSEFGIGRYYTRATLTRALFGSTSEHLTQYSELLAQRVRQGAA